MMSMVAATRFPDRRQAGIVLGRRLVELGVGDEDTLVLGLPRGGVPVAAEVAGALRCPYDVFVVRKLGVPGHRELAMGAIASGGIRVMNDHVVANLRIDDAAVEQVARGEQLELARREQTYRGDRPPPELGGRTIILVDDGLATGATMRAAVEAVRQRSPARLVVAVPTGAAATCAELARTVDDVVCLASPEPFYAVGLSYEDFSPTTDEEVARLLSTQPR
jgi:predicted phosphoribosyltransferase